MTISAGNYTMKLSGGDYTSLGDFYDDIAITGLTGDLTLTVDADEFVENSVTINYSKDLNGYTLLVTPASFPSTTDGSTGARITFNTGIFLTGIGSLNGGTWITEGLVCIAGDTEEYLYKGNYTNCTLILRRNIFVGKRGVWNQIPGSSGYWYTYNNIFIDTPAGIRALECYGMVAMNNTFVDPTTGISDTHSALASRYAIYISNLMYGIATDGFNGTGLTYNARGRYNATDDETGEDGDFYAGSNNISNIADPFLNYANDNLYIGVAVPLDGEDNSAYGFTTDFFGRARTKWTIGALECITHDIGSEIDSEVTVTGSATVLNTKFVSGEIESELTVSGAIIRMAATNIEGNINSQVSTSALLSRVVVVSGSIDITTVVEGNAGRYDAQLYTAFPFQLEPINTESKGRIASVLLHVSNITRYLQPYLESLSGGMGTTVKLSVVNTGCVLDSDTVSYEENSMLFEVIDCTSDSQWVTFTLGAPNPLIQRFPLDRYYAEHCNSIFGDVVCSYAPFDIGAITLDGSNPVRITTTEAHGMVDGAIVTFQDIVGTVELNGNAYEITYIDTTSFSLVATDSSEFTAYTSGGIVGHAYCNRNLSDCRLRNNTARFNGFPSLRSGGVKFAQ